MGEGRGEVYGAEGETHLSVIVFIRALLEGGQTVRVIGGDVAHQSGVRKVRATRGAVLQDDRLTLGECPPQKGVIRGGAGGQDVIHAAASAAHFWVVRDCREGHVEGGLDRCVNRGQQQQRRRWGDGVSGASSSSILCAKWRMLAITSSSDNM
jgi:hypothetical protein